MTAAAPGGGGGRIDAIDALRGLVIVLMIIDHTREYAVGVPAVGDPMALAGLPPIVFWLRWLSHFCAPVFTLLAGMSVGLQRATGRGGAGPLARRGLLLIGLEFTVIHFAWTFSLVWPRFYAQVIWGLGVAMLALAAALALPTRVRFALGLMIVAGHNLLDPVHVEAPGLGQWLWAVLHDRQVLPLAFGYEVRTSYPVLPMIGLMWVGEPLGRWVAATEPLRRARVLMVAGGLACAAFVALRLLNVYGDPDPADWSGAGGPVLWSVLNVRKYPFSLAFMLMTIGPALLLLGRWSARVPRWTAPLLDLGRAPMFAYVAHLYLLHAGALLLALAAGHAWATFDFRRTITGLPPGVGLPMLAVVPVTLVLAAALAPASRWYARLRATGRYPLLKYL